jgi:hypothetical protein
MSIRFDGFYYARYEGLNEGGGAGKGVVFLRDGRIYGGDGMSCFLGEYEDAGNTIIARVKIYPLGETYRAITGDVVNAQWDLDDIRGAVPAGALPQDVLLRLNAQRYLPTHHAITLDLKRISTF